MFQPLQEEESNNTTLIDILHTVKNKKTEYESLLSRQMKIQKRQRQDQWSLDASPNSEKDPFLIHLQNLHQSIHQSLPEILSRIMYAAEALYKELSREYLHHCVRFVWHVLVESEHLH